MRSSSVDLVGRIGATLARFVRQGHQGSTSFLICRTEEYDLLVKTGACEALFEPEELRAIPPPKGLLHSSPSPDFSA